MKPGERAKRPVAIIVVILSLTMHVIALDFDVSPNKDGSLDVFLGIQWEYDELFFSGASAQYLNGSDRQVLESGFVATFDRTISVQADLIGVAIDEGPITIEAAANLKWDRMSIREIGYLDQDTTRFFFLNDRILNLVLPRIRFSGRLALAPFVVSLGGEYSPWLTVAINQELTISPGLVATPFSSAQPAHHAYSLNGRFRWSNPFLSPEFGVEYDDLRISYAILTAGGEAEISNRIQVIDVNAMLVLRIIDMNGLHPTVSVKNKWTRLTDLKAVAPTPSTTSRVQFGFGFEW